MQPFQSHPSQTDRDIVLEELSLASPDLVHLLSERDGTHDTGANEEAASTDDCVENGAADKVALPIKSRNTWIGARLTGWRSGLFHCIIISCIILTVNILFVIIAIAKFGVQSGAGTIYTVSCSVVNRWSTVLHLLINVLSSLLLGASNYCMQIICAPTRKELDRAHARADWLDVGVLSVRNICGRISVKRTLLYALLALSSLPVHLLYNSAIYKSLATYTYVVGMVQPDFLTNATYASITAQNQAYGNDLFGPLGIELFDLFVQSATNSSVVENLTSSDCVTEYGKEIVDSRSHVLLVGSWPSAVLANYSFMSYVDVSNWNDGQLPNAWICSDSQDIDQNERLVPCDVDKVKQNASDWIIAGSRVDYCLSRREQSQCKLNFSPYILTAVIVCDIVKTIIMIWTVLTKGDDPLVTIGDTIASYLTEPDKITTGLCSINRSDVRQSRIALLPAVKRGPASMSSTEHSAWHNTLSASRWFFSIGPCLLTVIIASALLSSRTDAFTDYRDINSFRLGFGELSLHEIVFNNVATLSLTGNALLANTPQLIVSVLWVSYNGLWTIMVSASEWNRYYLRAKPLRVTSPEGDQRSTYWLQLPFKYSIPLMITMMLLHWLISEGIFFSQVDRITPDDSLHASLADDNMLSSGMVSLVGYSSLPVLLAIILGALMILVTLIIGFRKFTNPMPLVSSCSIAIAAACHRPKSDDKAAYLPVSWGDVDTDDPDVGHFCFTSHPVHAPVPGKMYAWKRFEDPHSSKAARQFFFWRKGK